MDKKATIINRNIKSENRINHQENNQTALFHNFYEQFVDQVYRYLYARLNNRHEAEDLTSQTFLKALQCFSQLRDHTRFAPWVFRIARNLSNDYYRRFSREETELPEDMSSNYPDLLVSVISTERSIEIQKAIRKLSLQEQEILRLRFIGQLTLREIAEVIHQNESSLKKIYYRLLTVLKTQLEEV